MNITAQRKEAVNAFYANNKVVTPVRRTVHERAEQDEIVISRCLWPYSQEFKMNAIRMVREQNKSIHAVAYELDITKATLTRWLSRYDAAKARNERIAARNKPKGCAGEQGQPEAAPARHANVTPEHASTRKDQIRDAIGLLKQAVDLLHTACQPKHTA